MIELQLTDPGNLAIVFTGLLLGGILKGATGAGLPVIAVPFIASVFDIRVAVILLALPNFFTNIWQVIKFSGVNKRPVFTRNFAVAGALGAVFGTALLAFLPLTYLSLLAALIIVVYVVLKVVRPTFKITNEVADTYVYPVGMVAGVLQGALGLSAPISITFLHAIQLGRETFIVTISVFFAAMSLVQVPVQLWLELSNFKLVLLSLFGLIPILIGLPVGNWIGKRMSSTAFDITIMCMLMVLAIKIVFDVIYDL